MYGLRAGAAIGSKTGIASEFIISDHDHWSSSGNQSTRQRHSVG